MTIRQKTIAILVVFIALLVAALHISARHIFLDRFQQLEENTLHTNMLRVRAALDNRLRNLLSLTTDWSVWDMTYAFTQDKNQEYIDANLLPETLRALELNFIAIVDNTQHQVFTGYLDHNSTELSTASHYTSIILDHAKHLLAQSDSHERTGMISVNGRPMLFASKAILRSNGQGPNRGTLIMARWLTDELGAELASETQLDISLAPMSPTLTGTPFERTGPISTLILREGSVISGTMILRDVNNRPLYTLRIRMDRAITREGLLAIRANFTVISTAGFLFCLLVAAMLNKTIIARIDALSRQLCRGETAKTLELVTVEGKDELTALQCSINTLLRNIRTSEASYETFFLNNGTANAVLDRSGLIVLVNTEFERLTGKTKEELEQKAHVASILTEDATGFLRTPPPLAPCCPVAREITIHGREGVRHVLASLAMLHDQDRQILALQDITSLKTSQRQLLELSRELEERVRDRTSDLKRVNERLAEEIVQRRNAGHILETVSTISLSLSSSDNTTTAFRHLLNHVCELAPLDYGAAYLLNPQSGEFRLVVSTVPADTEFTPPVLMRGGVLLPGLIQTRTPFYISHEELSDSCDAQYFPTQARALGGLPIVFQSSVVAILIIATHTATTIPQSIRSILDAIAAQTGGAIVRITAQEHSARTAKEMEAIFENSAVGILHISENRIIRKVNHRVAMMFGYTRDELIGQHVQMLHQSRYDSETFARDFYPQLYADKELLNLEYPMKTADGEIRWFKLHGKVVDSDDPDIGLVWIIEDIHDMKIASEELARYMEELQEARDLQEENGNRLVLLVEELDSAKQAAESANKMKSEFLANVSHEIRTPMNAIMGMTDIVLGSEVSSEQRRCLSIVKNAAEELLDIINGVLDLSKIEAGQFDLEKRPFNLRDVIEKSVLTLALSAAEKGLDLICDLPADLPREVEGDPVRLRQILINLLGNALKFTPSGYVRLTCQIEDPFNHLLHFQVEDSGIGIPPAKQVAIFDDFTQVDSSATRVYGGTGLGLSICRKLVTLMQGAIWVESTPGQGSTFHFTARMSSLAPPDTQHFRIFEGQALVAVNNPLIRDQVARLLRFWGLSVQTGDCVEAIARTALHDVAIFDTDFNDADCLTAIQRHGDTQSTPAVILTHLGDHGDQLRHNHIISTVTKPLRQDDLLTALGKAFGRHLDLPEKTSSAPALTSSRPLSILLVEDVATNRELAELLLRKMGHTVHDSRDGLDALTMLGRHSYDLIFMDLQMPVMDGFTATRIIRACEEDSPTPSDMDDSFLVSELRRKIQGTHTPVVAMTAHAMHQDRQRCLDIGMDAYITKPLRLDEVYKILSEIGASLPVPQAAPSADWPTSHSLPAPPESAPSPQEQTPATYTQRILNDLESRLGLDREQALPLIESLIESLTEHRSALETAQNIFDLEQLLLQAHSIKGMLMNMGLTSEAGLAKELETLCRNKAPLDELRPAANALLLLSGRILNELANQLTISEHEETP